MNKIVRAIYFYILSLLGLVTVMLIVFISMAIGLFGMSRFLELTLLNLRTRGSLDLSPVTIYRISMWAGALLGMPFFAFLSAKWLRQSVILNFFFRDSSKKEGKGERKE
jgi:hypothetical protein